MPALRTSLLKRKPSVAQASVGSGTWTDGGPGKQKALLRPPRLPCVWGRPAAEWSWQSAWEACRAVVWMLVIPNTHMLEPHPQLGRGGPLGSDQVLGLEPSSWDWGLRRIPQRAPGLPPCEDKVTGPGRELSPELGPGHTPILHLQPTGWREIIV